MDIFDRISALLAEKGVSGAQMSRELGFSSAVYTQWKQGKQKPSSQKVALMADYFGVTADWLLTGREPKHPQPQQDQLQDIYFRFGKMAQEMQLSERDMEFMLEFAKMHELHNRAHGEGPKGGGGTGS